MVSLEEAVIARLKKGEEHFEVLVDPYAAADFIDGKDINIVQNLAIDAVFKDSKKGTHASEDTLIKHFGTSDITEITKQIILKGVIQLTTEQRHKMQKNKKARIIEAIARNAMDPKTKSPHPRQRIELAMDQAGVHVDPFKPVSEQVKTIIDLLRPIIPISMENIRISVKIPAEYIGRAYGTIRNFGSLERENWESDGSWLGIIKLPAGMQNDFYDKLNDATKGNVSTKILK
ncbi:MAG: rRNA metabolism protein [Euryarchaeota archaeon RBG_13_31_8]|nr:MAG: rRNA metabolism protein [Euryarchaeota archaeon RBG_13_31_8]